MVNWIVLLTEGQRAVTLAARGPLSLGSESKLTLAPSARVRWPSAMTALWWTKRSFEPSSGVMKPKPFSSLNHFTLPVAIAVPIPCHARDDPRPAGGHDDQG